MLFASYAFAGHHIGSDNAYINLYRLLLLILGIAVLKRCHGIFLLEKSVEMLYILISHRFCNTFYSCTAALKHCSCLFHTDVSTFWLDSRRRTFAFFILAFFTASWNVIPDFSLIYLERYGFERLKFSASSSSDTSV